MVYISILKNTRLILLKKTQVSLKYFRRYILLLLLLLILFAFICAVFFQQRKWLWILYSQRIMQTCVTVKSQCKCSFSSLKLSWESQLPQETQEWQATRDRPQISEKVLWESELCHPCQNGISLGEEKIIVAMFQIRKWN